MQISGLPVSTAFGAADVLAIEINGVTYKITGATLAAALQSMGDYVTAQDIANNLTTTDEGYVLDARQGKALLDAIEALGAADVGAVAADQGSGNAGKALVVGNDGNVTTGDAGIPDAVKVSLLNLVRHVVYTDDQGQAYYDALYAALYANVYPRIVATYTPGSHVVYTDDNLDTLREYLTVKQVESAGDSGTIVTDYILSGTLKLGDSAITIRRGSLTTEVQINARYALRQTNNDFLIQHNTSGYLEGIGANIYLDTVSSKDTTRRRIVSGSGSVPYVYYQSGGTPSESEYYPIPIPSEANYIKVTTTTTGLELGFRFMKLENGAYQSYAIPAPGFNAVPVERYFDSSSDLYMLLFMKKSNDTAFDSASEPTGMVIEFGVEDFYNISEWNYPGNLVRVQGGAVSLGSSPNYTPAIYKPSSGSVSRNTVVVNHGLSGMDSVHWSGDDTDLGPTGYYLVPIPVWCNTVTFECDPSSYYASIRVWHYDGDNNWTRKWESGWQTGRYMFNFSTSLTEGNTGYYASVNIKFNSSGSVGADVSGFSMTFGRSND